MINPHSMKMSMISAVFWAKRKVWRQELPSSNDGTNRVDCVCLSGRLVPPDPVDARKAQRNSGFVPRAVMGAVKGQLDDKLLFDLTDRPEAIDGVGAHPFVQLAEFLVSETGIGFAHRYDFIAAPDLEGVVGIEGTSPAHGHVAHTSSPCR